MNSCFVGTIVFICVFGAAWLAMRLRAALPEHHRGTDTKDTVKLAMGLVATMSALVLGLLVASAKGSYDTQRTAVIQMAGKAVFLDRVLAHYGPEAAEARATLRQAMEGAMAQIWPDNSRQAAQLAPNVARSEAPLDAIQKLAPQNDPQHALKAQAQAIACGTRPDALAPVRAVRHLDLHFAGGHRGLLARDPLLQFWIVRALEQHRDCRIAGGGLVGVGSHFSDSRARPAV